MTAPADFDAAALDRIRALGLDPYSDDVLFGYGANIAKNGYRSWLGYDRLPTLFEQISFSAWDLTHPPAYRTAEQTGIMATQAGALVPLGAPLELSAFFGQVATSAAASALPATVRSSAQSPVAQLDATTVGLVAVGAGLLAWWLL